jgi:hypothetical protein
MRTIEDISCGQKPGVMRKTTKNIGVSASEPIREDRDPDRSLSIRKMRRKSREKGNVQTI